MADGTLIQLISRGQADSPLAPPRIDDDRCVHSLVADASCRRCKLACPCGAIEFSDLELTVDGAKCDGCGLCVPACPQRAIVGHGSTASHGDTLFAACQHVAALGSEGVLPCLHSIGVDDLTRAWRAGVRKLCLAHGRCDGCARNGRERHFEAVAVVNALLESRELETVEVTELASADWRGALAAARRRRDVHPQRRRFLSAGLTELVGLVSPPAGESAVGRPARPTAMLPNKPAAVFVHVPEVDELACTACDACVRICPSGALDLVKQEDQAAYAIEPALCTGCAMCRDVCEPKAIRIARLCVSRQSAVRLSTCRCRACGAAWHAPGGEAKSELCRICQKTQRHRLLYQVVDA